MKKFIGGICLLLAFSSFAQTSVNGLWHSSFVIMGQPFLMDLEVAMDTNEAFLINPELSGSPKLPCSDVVYNNQELSFGLSQAELKFKGTYFEKGDSLVGMMTQSGLEWTVVFGRNIVQKAVVSRPQTPHAPFPYKTEEVEFVNKSDGTTVFGTFTFPINLAVDYPIVIFASGSGPQDRNCNIFEHQSFWVLADMLARQGIASFRFDDRGTGKSKASYAAADLNDFASDVVASIDYISTQSSFKGHSIGLMGHSEGGMHILLAQNQRKKQVKFMVFLASIGLSGKETLIQQQYEIPLKNGMDETYAQWNKAVFEGITERVIAEKDQAKCAANLQTFLHDMAMKAPVGTLDTSATGIEAFVKTTADLMNNDWGRQFLTFNAGDYLKKLNLPVLAVFGSEDAQVNPISNSEAFKRMFTEKQLAQSQIEILPGLNHLLQTCKKCDIMEYGDLTETMSPLVFSKLVPFIHHL